MDNSIDLSDTKAAAEYSRCLSKKALELYNEQELDVSDSTKALLNLYDKGEAYYVEIIKEQAKLIELWKQNYKKMEHIYYTEKQKRTGDFKNN